MRALSLVGAAVVSMALFVRAETPPIGCDPCPVAPPPLPAPHQEVPPVCLLPMWRELLPWN